MARRLNCEVFLVQRRFFCDICRTLHKISFAKSEFTHQFLQFLTNYSARRHGTTSTKTRAFVDHITGALREQDRSRRFLASAVIW